MDNDDNPVEDPNPRIDNYRIPKIPPFFKRNPNTWFARVEATLRSARITSQATKADIVFAALEEDISEAVCDLMSQPQLPDDIYDQLKKGIITAYADSTESKLRKLLKGEVLTEGKPSLILNRLKNLNNGVCNEPVLKTLFFEHLNSNTRSILSASGLDSLEKLAELADTIHDQQDSSSLRAHAFSGKQGDNNVNVAAHSTSSDTMNELIESVKQLTTRLSRIEKNNSNYRSNRARNRSKSQPRHSNKDTKNENSHKREPQGVRLCFGHFKYPDNVRNCQTWCVHYKAWLAQNPDRVQKN